MQQDQKYNRKKNKKYQSLEPRFKIYYLKLKIKIKFIRKKKI